MSWRWVALGIAGVAVGGCGEPVQIVPVVPPGAQVVRVPPTGVDGTAQALGEQAGRAAADPTKAAATVQAEAIPPATPTAKGETKTTRSGVVYETLKEGTGPEAKAGQKIRIHYTGTLENGKKFDSSRDRGQPFPVTIGIGQVIKGWDEGVPGMKVGELRRLTIPSQAAYGLQGRPPKIPPDATLIFDVELMGIDE